MQLINWLALQPLLADVDRLNAFLQEALPVRDVCRSLVEITLQGYPWRERSDLIPCYHPTRTYHEGQWIALPVPELEELHPAAWQVAQVKSAETTGNLVQGRFQALTLEVGGRDIHKTAGISGASYQEPRLSGCTPEELSWLAEWVAGTYAGSLLTTIRKLIQKGRVCGQVADEMFLPEQLFALSLDRLEPFFDRLSSARRWVSLEEILQGLPDLSCLKRETAVALVHSTLKVSPYRSLGGDRWTTSEIFTQLDRPMPHGLPVSHLRSKISPWTEQDKKDLAKHGSKPIPVEAALALEELGLQPARSQPDPSLWQPLRGSIQLPALTSLHITQACFPLGEILHAFPPEARMVFVQFIDGDHLPFLVDREQNLLKAIHPESLQAHILESGIPAGTHLWLEHQGEERYCITPRPLPSKCLVPGKVVSFDHGKLYIQQAQIQVECEGASSVFKVDLSLEELQALHAMTGRETLSLRDVLASAIQELCAANTCRTADRLEIFNLLFLMQACSPQAAAVLLYTLPCFERLPDDTFRYRLLPDAQVSDVWKSSNRVSRLWEDLVANCVTPDPVSRGGTSSGVFAYQDRLLSPGSEPGLPTLSELTPQEAEIPLRSFFSGNQDADEFVGTTLVEKVGLESIHLIQQVKELFSTSPVDIPALDPEQENDLGTTPGPSEEQETARSSLASMVGYPVFVKVSSEPDLQPGSSIDTRRMAYGLKIPARPLHKRPIYQRLLFCLGGWIHGTSGKS